MATTLDEYYPFDAGAGADSMEDRWRQMGRLWLPNGPIAREANGCEPYGDSSGLQIKVKTGRYWIRGHLGIITAEKTIALAAVGAIPGGQSRIDRIVMRLDPTSNVIELDKLTGTPAGSPAVPALTQAAGGIWEETLCKTTALTNATTLIAAGNVTDERVLVAPNGEPVGCRLTRAANLSVTTGGSGVAIPWDTEDEDTDGFFAPTSSTITIPAGMGGIYDITVRGSWASSPAGSGSNALFVSMGSRQFRGGIASALTFGSVPMTIIGQRLAAGDTVVVTAYQSTGGSINITAIMELWRRGPAPRAT